MAKELGPKGIRVNAISPGVIRTETPNKERQEQFRQQTVLRRLGEPEEVARVVAFLAGNGASYITGQTVDVGGGI